MRSTVLTAEDRAIFDRMSVRLEGQYRHADALDALITRRRMLPSSGSIVDAVAREEAELQLRAQRHALVVARDLTELVAASYPPGFVCSTSLQISAAFSRASEPPQRKGPTDAIVESMQDSQRSLAASSAACSGVDAQPASKLKRVTMAVLMRVAPWGKPPKDIGRVSSALKSSGAL